MGDWLNLNVDKFGKLMLISFELKQEKADLYTLHKEVYCILLCFVVVIHDGNFYKTNQYAYLCSSMILLLRCFNWAQVVERRFHVQFLGPSAFP